MPVQLLQYTDPVIFSFEHAMNSRPWIGVWSDKRRGYSGIPYWIGHHYADPVHDTPEWRLIHAQSHTDTLYAPPDPIGPFTAPVPKVLDLSGPTAAPESAAWWVFNNWNEHYLTEQNMAQNQWQLYFPFW
jgi:hypothetical protein